MLSRRLAENKYVIQVNHYTLVQQIIKHHMHQPLKGGWSISKTEGHDLPLEGSITAVESRFALVLWCNHHLVIPIPQIQLAKHGSALQTRKQLINPRYGKTVRYGNIVEASVINAEPQSAILLSCE